MTRKPAPLRRGDVIGVVSPAAAVDEASLHAGLQVLEAAGFRVRLGAATLKKAGYLAGTDRERLADLDAMFRDPEVKAIIAARGGYGSGRLLPLLDPAVPRTHPKIFVGHSDLTFLLNDFVQRAELLAFHGPMIASLAQRPDAAATLFALLSGDRAGWHQAAPSVVQPGMAEGVLVGGSLSVIVSMLGTPWALQTRGRLLFLEDVNEKPYRIDRMLTQLRQAGGLDGVAGVIFGEMPGCTAGEDERVTVRDVINEAFASAPYPVAFGLPSGHGAGTLALPLGARTRLAGERLTLLESPLAE
ncbi:MAG TPA: LD-carboxypeptidase [Candidatus Margulisiibacteriota bacterium]|nr:LD-carboxypeptidase [Candidatus Margulisiibacteriota bacterium]